MCVDARRPTGLVENCCQALTVPAGSQLMAMQLEVVFCLYVGACWLLNLFFFNVIRVDRKSVV